MSRQLAKEAWYIVNTYSTHEAKTAANLIRRIETMGMQNYILRVLDATIEVPVMKDGLPTGKVKSKSLYPGHIFVEMIMTDDSWYVVRNTPGVTGIAGSSGGGQKPTPISTEEIEPILKRMGMIDKSMYERYTPGTSVKIVGGPLEGTEGVIETIDNSTGAVRVKTVFFGRETVVDVEFSEIELN